MCPADDNVQLREFKGQGMGLFVSEFMSFSGLIRMHCGHGPRDGGAAEELTAGQWWWDHLSCGT